MNTALIKGAVKLTSIFGEWPSFHDGEVLSIKMERNGPPSLRLEIVIGRDIPEEPADKSYFKVKGTWIVTLWFSGISKVVLEDFNHQNVVMEIVIHEHSPHGREVLVNPIYGLYGKLLCESAEVVSVKSVDSWPEA